MSAYPTWVRGTADPSASLGMTKGKGNGSKRAVAKPRLLEMLIRTSLKFSPSPFDKLRAGSTGLILLRIVTVLANAQALISWNEGGLAIPWWANRW
jgi:hypothetical protein